MRLPFTPILAALTLLTMHPAHAATTNWKPDQLVEIVVGTAPGSGPDRSARFSRS